MKKYIFILLSAFSGTMFCQSEKRQYEGFMKGNGDYVGIEMKLTFEKDSVYGIYYYQKIGNNLAVRGHLKNNILHLEEHNSAGKTTGTFEGIYDEAKDSLYGKWIRKKDNSSFTFGIKRTQWEDYKLIERNVTWYRGKKAIADERTLYSEWLEMSDNPNIAIQNAFNGLSGNQPAEQPDPKTEAGAGFYGVNIDGSTMYYTNYKEVELKIKTNQFISFGDYHSDFWGGSVDNRMGYYLFDLSTLAIIHLKDILRKDTASFTILSALIKTKMKKEGKWNQFVEDFGNLGDFINETKYTALEQFYLTEDGIYFFFCRLPYSNIFSIEDTKIEFTDFIKILDKNSSVYYWLTTEKKIH